MGLLEAVHTIIGVCAVIKAILPFSVWGFLSGEPGRISAASVRLFICEKSVGVGGRRGSVCTRMVGGCLCVFVSVWKCQVKSLFVLLRVCLSDFLDLCILCVCLYVRACVRVCVCACVCACILKEGLFKTDFPFGWEIGVVDDWNISRA